METNNDIVFVKNRFGTSIQKKKKIMFDDFKNKKVRK